MLGTKNIEVSGITANCDNNKKGTNIIAPVRDAKKSTGITAFPLNDTFLVMSYNPKKKHDTNPSAIHKKVDSIKKPA
jgi:hypothetical protein